MTRNIPLTARSPRPFTPATLDRRFREQLDLYDARRRAISDNSGRPDADKLEVPDGPETKPYRPVFWIAVPTTLEREEIGGLLFECGVIQVQRDTVRNTMLEACFELFGDEKGEDEAAFLEGHWQQEDIYEQLFVFYTEQEKQRVLDEFHGAEPREREPLPERNSTLRDRLRAKTLIDSIIAGSSAVRHKIKQQEAYNRINGLMLIRTHLRGWEGVQTQREAIHPAANGQGYPPAELLTEECANKLRAEIGLQAWIELISQIDGMYDLSREEVGNSGWLPDGQQTDAGSSAAAEAPESSGGNSPGTETETSSFSEPVPPSVSDQTTTQSSPPTIADEG